VPLLILDHGTNNRVEVDPFVMEQSSGTIVFTGSNNTIAIGAQSSLVNASISLGNNCSFSAAFGCRLAAIEVMATSNGHVVIGTESNFTWHTRLFLHEAGRIQIGSGCLLASDTMMTVSDMHSLIDCKTGMRINPAADIIVEDKVWLAYSVIILKGSTIGYGSAVGIGSIVSRAIPPYSLAVGRPAAVIRSEVTWDAGLL